MIRVSKFFEPISLLVGLIQFIGTVPVNYSDQFSPGSKAHTEEFTFEQTFSAKSSYLI